MIRAYVTLGAVAFVLLVGWRYGEMRYTAGADAITVAYAESLAAAKEKEKEDVKEIIKWREKKVIEYRDRIRTIKAAKDPSGCLDSSLSDVGLGRLLRAGDGSARPDNDAAIGSSPAD